MPDFADRVESFFREYFRLQPVAATEAGEHDFDGEWPDLGEDGRTERLAFADRWIAELAAVPDGELDGGERLDRDLLLTELEAARFAEMELREERWDPLAYIYLLGAGIFPLLAREVAPLADRLLSVTRRLEGLPAVLATARRELRGLPGRPVSRLHAETALRRLDGITALSEQAIAMAADAAPLDRAVAEVEERLRAAGATAGIALAEFQAWLSDDLLPRTEGEGRLGGELFDRKLRHTLRSTLSSDEILERAAREYRAVRAEMLRLARELWGAWIPDRRLPSQEPGEAAEAYETRIVRAVLDAIATVHPRSEELLDFCRAELGRIEAFVRERALLTLADEPLEIIWTPDFLRSSAGAMLVPPGPLDRDQKSFFCITPPPVDWTPQQVESALREDNERMLRLLTIHEAVPGHYLQLAHANRCRSLARAVLRDGVFAEGWAVYVTQVMLDQGYGSDDPALLLTHWKFYLRSVVNAILDIRVHGGRLSEAEAIALMVDGAFQEESEARAKWDRARLTSTQLSTYFVGSTELWDLERERRAQLAGPGGTPLVEAGDAPDRPLGGRRSAPGFDYRTWLDELLAHGTPPIPLLRRAVLAAEATDRA